MQLAEDLGRDVRVAARAMLRSPAFTAVAVLTLALAIGASTAIFSIVDAVLFRPLPLPDADRLVHVWREQLEWGILRQEMGARLADLPHFRERADMFVDWQAYTSDQGDLIGPEGPERVRVGKVTDGFFRMMGFRIVDGRTFNDEDLRSGEPVVLLSSRSTTAGPTW
ncbi:MAG: ABC transporter permease [Acidobacteria bacterium]|nr:ABC transporter permease [Acidobacteriota bacterium]